MAMLCPGCFQEKPAAAVCPHCGYDESLKRSPLVLPHHTRLYQDRYQVGRVLGKPGGFGLTYLGWDERLQTRVAIKEYLPRELAGRDADHRTVAAHSREDAENFRYGLGKFLEEARTLARLDHPNLVRVRDFFEENGTAYLVMDYYGGLTLAEYLTRQPGGRIPEAQAIGILLPILDGLREVHAKGFLHRDIKPANIYLTAGNRPILLDFGAARQAMGEHSRSLSVVLSEGYAPIEQYQRNGKQGPWTDVYGAAATLYTMLTGQVPPSATDRLGEDSLPGLGELSPTARIALRHGLAFSPAQRPARIGDWQRLLLEETQAPAHAPIAMPRSRQAPKTPKAPAQAAEPLQPVVPVPELVRLPGGAFWMGSPDRAGGFLQRLMGSSPGDERRHEVTVRPFAIGKYPVTQAEWRAVMGDNPSTFGDCDDCPVETVSWEDAMAYIQQLNTLTGQRFRLPTEAEWEYACRANQYTRHAGSDNIDTVAWYNGNSGGQTHSVGQKQPNAFGLHDMSGNVWEWTASAYVAEYDGSETSSTNDTKASRVNRGGSWGDAPGGVRSANRDWNDPAGRSSLLGFRLAQD